MDLKKLVKKYSKDQLANLLIKHKNRRISNALCAAYNRKCGPVSPFKSDSHKTKVWDYYHVKRRALGAAKIIGGRILKECTPPELLIAGKCVMLVGGVIDSVSTAGNPVVVSGTISAARSIIKNS